MSIITEVVHSKKNDEVVKVVVSGKVGRIPVAGETIPVHLGLTDLAKPGVVGSFTGRINRAEGGNLPYGTQRKVDEAVRVALQGAQRSLGLVENPAPVSGMRSYEDERLVIAQWIRDNAPEYVCLDEQEDRDTLVEALQYAAGEQDMFSSNGDAWTDVILWVRDTHLPYCLDDAEDRKNLALQVEDSSVGRRKVPNPKKLKAKLLK